jgi:hypothetical protein
MKEVCIVPTYRRNAHLSCALRRIREQDAFLPIFVFSDRGEDNRELREVCYQFDAELRILPVHDFYGNSYCVMEALRWACSMNFELVFVNEDDTMQHPDCLDWHRRQHVLFEDIFCSCGWVFNLHAPISDDVMFAPWFYAPNYAIKQDKLGVVVKHANPRYYCAMREYVLKTFPDSILHNHGRVANTNFFEQDAIFQFCLMQDGSQVAWNAAAKCDHIGAHGYNKPTGPQLVGPLAQCVAELEAFIADPYARMEVFGRAVVEREIGSTLPKRERRFRITLSGGWSTEVLSELATISPGSKIHSHKLPADAVIERI